jgi:hypothetical protein
MFLYKHILFPLPYALPLLLVDDLLSLLPLLQLFDLPLSLLFELTTVLIVLQLFTLVTRLFPQFVALI